MIYEEQIARERGKREKIGEGVEKIVFDVGENEDNIPWVLKLFKRQKVVLSGNKEKKVPVTLEQRLKSRERQMDALKTLQQLGSDVSVRFFGAYDKKGAIGMLVEGFTGKTINEAIKNKEISKRDLEPHIHILKEKLLDLARNHNLFFPTESFNSHNLMVVFDNYKKIQKVVLIEPVFTPNYTLNEYIEDVNYTLDHNIYIF